MKINFKQLLLLKREGLAPEDIEVKIYDRMVPFHLEKGSYIRKDKWSKNNLLDMITCDGFNIDEKCIFVPEDSSAADELLDIIDEAIHGVWKRCDEVKKVTDNSFVSDVLMALEGEVTDILESINDDIEGVIKKYGLENVTQKNNSL